MRRAWRRLRVDLSYPATAHHVRSGGITCQPARRHRDQKKRGKENDLHYPKLESRIDNISPFVGERNPGHGNLPSQRISGADRTGIDRRCSMSRFAEQVVKYGAHTMSRSIELAITEGFITVEQAAEFVAVLNMAPDEHYIWKLIGEEVRQVLRPEFGGVA